MIVGINVIRPRGKFQVVFLFDVCIVYIIDCNTLCSLGIQSILQVASDLLFLFAQLDQIFSVDGMPLSVSVCIRIRVAPVCSLTLPRPERIAAGVFSALCQSVYLLLGEAQLSQGLVLYRSFNAFLKTCACVRCIFSQ